MPLVLELVYTQGNFLFINSKTAKHFLDIRGTSAFECSGDFLDLNPLQEV